MDKKMYFYIDDVIWVLRDLNIQRPKSIFENQFLNMLKMAHDRYGTKVQLNLFYRTDFFYGSNEFTLHDMTDKYKSQFEEVSSWLKFAFHAKQEFPDFPYINASYDDVKKDFESIRSEVIRFAGEKSFTYATVFHWNVTSKDGCRALRDCGVKLLNVTHSSNVSEYNGDKNSLPYGHAGRLLQNRKAETAVYKRETKDTAIANSICGYNHITDEEFKETDGNFKTIYNEETGLHFKVIGNIILNLWELDKLDEAFIPLVDLECMAFGIHEQYFYPDYYAYQPDYAEKILKAASIAAENGYTCIFMEDILK